MTDQEPKLPLPQFLKILTNNGIPAAKAMVLTGKIYKIYNTPTQLKELTDPKLATAGLLNKEDRKIILAAFRKAGYVYTGKAVTKREAIEKNVTGSPGAGSSVFPPTIAASPKRKRKSSSDDNEFLPDSSQKDYQGSLDFNEILDEEKLRNKSCVINRAPIMTAWSVIVAECLGFKREEALSIASVYTEMNAISKGVSLGIFNKGKGKGMEASTKGTQPYVDIMGRSPLYKTQDGQWRALSNGSPVLPSTAFSYISRSFRQTTPFVLGALRLLALSYPPNVLSRKGWSLYADFRPEDDGWGKRSEVRCDTILHLRHRGNTVLLDDCQTEAVQPVVPTITIERYTGDVSSPSHDEPESKKVRITSLEECEGPEP